MFLLVLLVILFLPPLFGEGYNTLDALLNGNPEETQGLMNLHDASLTIIRAGQAPSGAYVASPTFSQYGYCWLRDGTWIAYAMDIAGDHAS